MDATPNTLRFSVAFQRGVRDAQSGRKIPVGPALALPGSEQASYLAGFRRGRTLRNRKMRAQR